MDLTNEDVFRRPGALKTWKNWHTIDLRHSLPNCYSYRRKYSGTITPFLHPTYHSRYKCKSLSKF